MAIKKQRISSISLNEDVAKYISDNGINLSEVVRESISAWALEVCNRKIDKAQDELKYWNFRKEAIMARLKAIVHTTNKDEVKFLEESIPILEKTPEALKARLRAYNNTFSKKLYSDQFLMVLDILKQEEGM